MLGECWCTGGVESGGGGSGCESKNVARLRDAS